MVLTTIPERFVQVTESTKALTANKINTTFLRGEQW